MVSIFLQYNIYIYINEPVKHTVYCMCTCAIYIIENITENIYGSYMKFIPLTANTAQYHLNPV